jgi:hypothetical protein
MPPIRTAASYFRSCRDDVGLLGPVGIMLIWLEGMFDAVFSFSDKPCLTAKLQHLLEQQVRRLSLVKRHIAQAKMVLNMPMAILKTPRMRLILSLVERLRRKRGLRGSR